MGARADLLTDRIAGNGRASSLGARARARRQQRFAELFPDLRHYRVLDLGGMPEFWRTSELRPEHVTTVNLFDADPEEPWLTHRVDDACAGGFGDYDLVMSNSLIEHLGGHTRRERFAAVVRESAPRHWIQTPYRYFPVEPHWLFPGFQFLPFSARVAVTQRWPLGYCRRDSIEAATEVVHEVELMSATQLRSYFPDAQIWFERYAGVPKSIVAIRT